METRSYQKQRSASRGNSQVNPPPFIRNRKIMHQEIFDASQSSSDLRGGLVGIYCKEVLSQKTRTVRLLGIKNDAKIIQTLLGYEVQAMHKRIHCPDLVTARYLRLFSELGCHSIRIPYDPTVTARLIPIMEQAYQCIEDAVAGIFPKKRERRQYVLRKICAIVRNELRSASLRALSSEFRTQL